MNALPLCMLSSPARAALAAKPALPRLSLRPPRRRDRYNVQRVFNPNLPDQDPYGTGLGIYPTDSGAAWTFPKRKDGTFDFTEKDPSGQTKQWSIVDPWPSQPYLLPAFIWLTNAFHYLTFVTQLVVAYTYNTHFATASTNGLLAIPFFLTAGPLFQAMGGAGPNVMHEYEGWWVAPFQSYPTDPKRYNNDALRQVAYRALFQLQAVGAAMVAMAVNWAAIEAGQAGALPTGLLGAIIQSMASGIAWAQNFVTPWQTIAAVSALVYLAPRTVTYFPINHKILPLVGAFFGALIGWAASASIALPTMAATLACLIRAVIILTPASALFYFLSGRYNFLMPPLPVWPGTLFIVMAACQSLALGALLGWAPVAAWAALSLIAGGVLEAGLAEGTYDQRFHWFAVVLLNLGGWLQVAAIRGWLSSPVFTGVALGMGAFVAVIMVPALIGLRKRLNEA